MKPLHNYIAQKKREFHEKFPQIYDGSGICIQAEVEAFLTSCMTGMLDIVEQEIDALYASEQEVIDLKTLAAMLQAIRQGSEARQAPLCRAMLFAPCRVLALQRRLFLTS